MIFDAIISKMSVLQVNPAMVIQAHLVSEDDTFKSLIETQRKQNVNQHRRRTLADYGKNTIEALVSVLFSKNRFSVTKLTISNQVFFKSTILHHLSCFNIRLCFWFDCI